MNITAVPITTRNLHATSVTAARAFAPDPAFEWFLPDPETRVEKLTGFFDVFTGDQLRTDFVDATTTPDATGVCVWMGPEKWQPPTRLASVWRVTRIAGVSVLGRFLRAETLFKKHHPKQPHWYLQTLAVEPSLQRSGIGRTLLQPGLDRCDEQGLGAYLETQKLENVAYYQGFGFRVEEEVTIGRKGPRIWLMWRDPR